MIEIDYKELAADTLDNLLAEIVLRDGADFGSSESAFKQSKLQLMRLLQTGQSKIFYNDKEDYCKIIPREV